MQNRFKCFGIVGGDKRQLFLADALVREGFRAVLGGFDSLRSFGQIRLADVRTAITDADAVLLPLPPVRANGSLNTPYAEGNVYFDEEELALLRDKPVFTAMRDRLLRAAPALRDARVYDYAARDDFAILNAVPTAEGAVACAMNAYEGTIAGTNCLVVGFGRIGKLLARLLRALGASVTVSARSDSDCAYIRALGYGCRRTDRLGEVSGFRLVFNTVPALIFDRGMLQKTDRDALLIDLASLPGGVDFEAARALGIDARRALSLPGKCAPKTAGEIIKTTVFRMIEEVNW